MPYVPPHVFGSTGPTERAYGYVVRGSQRSSGNPKWDEVLTSPGPPAPSLLAGSRAQEHYEDPATAPSVKATARSAPARARILQAFGPEYHFALRHTATRMNMVQRR